MLSRKNRMSVSGIAVLLLFEVLQAQAQNPPPGPVLPPLFQYNPRAVSEAPLYQERKLEMTMTTDRTVYFTGEQLEVTVTTRNPAREPLTVKQPFLYGTGGIATLRRPLGSSNENDWQFENPDPILYQMPYRQKAVEGKSIVNMVLPLRTPAALRKAGGATRCVRQFSGPSPHRGHR